MATRWCNVENSEKLIKKEIVATDNDLNAIEAWGLGSSHLQSSEGEDPQQFLEKLFKADRIKVLTPQNVLNGVRTIEQENIVRTRMPYEDGWLGLFGPQYAMTPHRISLGELDADGVPSEIRIEIIQDGVLVDPNTLTLDPQYKPFYEPPLVDGSQAVLRFRHDV